MEPMPISSWQAISDIMAEVVRLDPKSVLDLGAGFGIYGALCRNYLDARHGRCNTEDWDIQIDGIEGFSRYRNPLWQTYNSLSIWDFSDPKLGTFGYDLVLMVDSLEHLEPEAGAAFLDKLVAGNKHVIVSVPNGVMEQGAAHGNELECHRTTYFPGDFGRFPGVSTIHLGLCIVVSIPGGL